MDTADTSRRGLVDVWTILWAVLCALIFMVSYYIDASRCSETCADGANQPAPPVHGLRWNHYDHSWQWTVQLELAGLALAAAVASVFLPASKVRQLAAMTSVVAVTAWALVLFA